MIDINNTLNDLVKVNVAIDDVTVETRLSTNSTSRFVEKSSFNKLLGLSANWDCFPNQLHLSENNLN